MEYTAEEIQCKKNIHVICIPFIINENHTNKSVYELIDKNNNWFDVSKKSSEIGNEADKENKEKDLAEWNILRNYQRDNYFHPFVLKFQKKSMRFQRHDLDKISVELSKENKEDSEGDIIELRVLKSEIVLYQPFMHIGIFLLEVETKDVSLKQTQKLLDEFRRLYPAYVDDWKEIKFGHYLRNFQIIYKKKCNKENFIKSYVYDNLNGVLEQLDLEDKKNKILGNKYDHLKKPVFKHWQELLYPFEFNANSNNDIYLTGDDRAPIMSWISIVNLSATDVKSKGYIDEGNWVRLCFADTPGGDKYPYSKFQLEFFEDEFCYDRFWYRDGESKDAPSRIMNCGYAFSYVGNSKDSGFFNNDKNGALNIFRKIYVEIGLIAYFQKATLLLAANKISELDIQSRGKTKGIKQVYKEFISFTQNYWFEEISPQEQGVALFKMWRTHLSIQQYYDQIRQEFKELFELEELESNRKLNNVVKMIGSFGLVISFCALLAGIWGMNIGNLPGNASIIMGFISGLATAIPLIFLHQYYLKNK